MISIRRSGLAFAALFVVAASVPALAQDTGTSSKPTRAQRRAERAERRMERENTTQNMSGGMQGGSMGMSATAIGADFQATVDRAIATLDAINRVIDGAQARNQQLRQEYQQRTGQTAPTSF